MKQVNKNVYKELSLNRKHLMITSLVVLGVAMLLMVGGILLIVFGSKNQELVKSILMIVFGIILLILSLFAGAFGVVALFTSFGMIKNTNGSVKDGNKAIGTVNVLKCDKCGEELPDNATFCSKCGTNISYTKTCKCGASNKADNEFCVKCGNKLKK